MRLCLSLCVCGYDCGDGGGGNGRARTQDGYDFFIYFPRVPRTAFVCARRLAAVKRTEDLLRLSFPRLRRLFLLLLLLLRARCVRWFQILSKNNSNRNNLLSLGLDDTTEAMVCRGTTQFSLHIFTRQTQIYAFCSAFAFPSSTATSSCTHTERTYTQREKKKLPIEFSWIFFSRCSSAVDSMLGRNVRDLLL